jgi:hypothetical protein
MIDLNNLNGLALSARATYLDTVSGAISPQTPFRYNSFLSFTREAVLASFEKAPPLVDATASTAITPGTSSTMSPERKVAMELSAFCDGALKYNASSNTVDGVIPIYPSSNRTFKPIAAVPIRISLVHLTHGHSTQPPLVFVHPLDQDMCLITTPNVNGETGQVFGINSLATWNARSTLTALLKEIQSAFSSCLPIQAVVLGSNNIVSQPSPSQNTTGSLGGQASPLSSPPQPSPPTAKDLMDSDARLCVICLDTTKTYIALPCRHLLFCSNCVQAFSRQKKQECPICRKPISDLFEIYT